MYNLIQIALGEGAGDGSSRSKMMSKVMDDCGIGQISRIATQLKK
jgi:hypothetical protein